MIYVELEEKDFPTEEEWNELERIFGDKHRKALSVIRKLKAGKNTPLRSTIENRELDKRRLASINKILVENKSRFRIRSLSRRRFDFIALKHDPEKNSI